MEENKIGKKRVLDEDPDLDHEAPGLSLSIFHLYLLFLEIKID